MEDALKRMLAGPPKCPSCRDVRLDVKDIEQNQLTEGGTIHWVCHRCGLNLVRAFE